MVAGDLSAQSLNRDKVFTIIPARTSARDDDVGERPSRHFDRSEAEWRNLTPHGTGRMAAGVLSAQNLESPDLSPIPAGSSARDDLWT